MPVVKSLEFIWTILHDRVEFKVQEPFRHKVCLFLNAPQFRRTPIKLQDWLEFCRKTSAPKDFVQKQIKFYNDLKKNKEKHQIKLDVLFSKYNTKTSTASRKPKKAVKKKV
jgi:hypothetical protein